MLSWPSIRSVRMASIERRSSRSFRIRSNRRWPIQISEASSPTSAVRTARTMSPGASPTRAAASLLMAICNWGRPVSCSARRSVSPRTSRIARSARSASRASWSRSGPKMRTDTSAGVPPSPSSMRMPSGVVNRTATPGRGSSRSRMSASIASSGRARADRSTTSTSETVCGMGSSVRSARPVRRTTSSTSGTCRSRSST